MKKVLFLLPLFLTGCVGLSQDKITVVMRKCPAIVSYSKAEQKKAYSEIKAMAANSQIPRMMGDYSKLRDACRVAMN